MFRKIVVCVLFVSLLISCKNQTSQKKEKDANVEQESVSQAETTYTSVGEEIEAKGALAVKEMSQKYQDLKIGDTLQVKFKATVVSVCKKKGCWMNLALPNEKEVMVKFKEYAFFVPKDIEAKEVVVNGKAFVSVMSVEDQRHYAQDGGQSEAEIAAITQPKKTLLFLADGVLIEE